MLILDSPSRSLLGCLYRFRGTIGHILGPDYIESRFPDDGLALVNVGALEAHDQGNGDLYIAGGVNHALGQHIALHDAAEDIYKHRLDVLV
jgi:hypothetical protein